jgi:hypothetical protein
LHEFPGYSAFTFIFDDGVSLGCFGGFQFHVASAGSANDVSEGIKHIFLHFFLVFGIWLLGGPGNPFCTKLLTLEI